MRECKQDMLAIGPTPKLDKAIKALEDAVSKVRGHEMILGVLIWH